MVGFTDRVSRGVLDHITGKTALFATTTPSFVGLFTAVGSDAGTGFTEVTGGAYARVSTGAAAWNAAAGTSPSTVTNASIIQFPTATVAWGTVIAFGIFDAATVGNLLVWDFLGNFSWLPFSATLASPSVLTAPAHGYANGDIVRVVAEFNGVLPATAGSWAGDLTVAGVTADTFTAGVNTTGTGNGQVRKITRQVVDIGVAPSYAVGAMTLVSA